MGLVQLDLMAVGNSVVALIGGVLAVMGLVVIAVLARVR